MASTIQLPDTITVGELADKLSLPVTRLITELMKNGVIATVNEKIDFDTAQIIVGELDLDVELKRHEVEELVVPKPEAAVSANAKPRPPVVAVMGHVDHGKTSLLDAIRGAEVVKSEAGGITQHISAYQVEHEGRTITLLDTPGHEAFAALREHSAMLTDLVIIVIAADDGVKPQTVEAIRFARKANVKMIVAITKIDKPGADINRIKQQLSDNELIIEEWGGDTIVLEVSAKTKKGVPELLNMILLVADVEELKADYDIPAEGLIIESHMEKGRGPVAEALVQQGTIKLGDFVVAGTTYAKVRNLENTSNKPISSATPATPIIISGFKALPQFGDTFKVVSDEKSARSSVSLINRDQASRGGQMDISSNELMRLIDRSTQVNELKIFIKADVQGSLTSVADGLKNLDTDEVAVRVVGSGVGTVSESDMRLAATSHAILYGFHVTLPTSMKQLAARDKVDVRLFNVIYELLDDVKKELSGLLAPEVIENSLGRLIVRGIFKITKSEVICGGEVTKGKLTIPALAKIMRDGNEIAEVEVVQLKRGPEITKEVVEGEMCGLSFKSKNRVDLQLGDVMELFTRELKSRSL